MEGRLPDKTGFLHADIVEQTLGVPLSPEGIDAPSGDNTIRQFAYVSVVGAVQERLRQRGRLTDLREADLGDITQELQEEPGIRKLAAELQAANDTLATWHSPPPMPSGNDGSETPRGRFQASAMATQVQHAQRAPSKHADPGNSYRDGLLTVAPPGSGKTLLQSLALNYAGIGQPVSALDQRRRKGVGILNSQVLIEQGLDPDGTLQRYLGVGGREVRVGAFYSARRDGHDEYDYLLTTPESYEKAVNSGAIDQGMTVRYVLDEAHRVALAPGMQQHVAEFGPGLYMYTATPAIARGRRDLRDHFPHAQFGSLKEFVEEGILSPVQLFTYRAGSETGSAERLAVSLAADYVRSGRKTLIVCQAGDEQRQARDIAAAINREYLDGNIVPDKRFRFGEEELACAVGTFAINKTKANLKRVRDNQRLVLTTVATGHEGLDIPDLDSLIIIGPQGASWVVEQWLGRVLRPSGRLAVASEILPYDLREGRPLASIFGAFGMERETIVAGHYIGPMPDEEDEEQADGLSLSPPILNNLRISEFDNPRPGEKVTARPPTMPLYTPPSEFEPYLVTGVSVREATVAPADLAKLPPDDYGHLLDLPPKDIPVQWLYFVLDQLDDPEIRYVGSWQTDEIGTRRLVRYYSPAAHAYLQEHSVEGLALRAELQAREIATLIGAPIKVVEDILERLHVGPLPHNPECYGLDALITAAREVENVPVADETDLPLPDLGAEIGSEHFATYFVKNPHNGIKPVLKRRNAAWGQEGYAFHITKEEVEIVRAGYEAVPVADHEKFMSYTEIARNAGVTTGTVAFRMNSLSSDEKPSVLWLRSRPGIRPSDFVSRAWGEAFAEHIKPERLMPWEVTLEMVAAYFGKRKTAMADTIDRRYTTEPEKISLPGVRDVAVYPMSIMFDLWAQGMVPIPEAPQIDARKVAMSAEHAHEKKRVANSQEVQRHFVSPERLVPPEEIDYYMARRVNPPPLPHPDLSSEEAQAADVPQPSPADAPTPRVINVEMAAESKADVAELQAKSGCTKEAFAILMQRIPFAPEDVERDGKGSVISLYPSGLEAFERYCSTISAPPVGWLNLSMLAHASGRTTRREVMVAVACIEEERGMLMSEKEVMLGRNGQEVDVYFESTTRRQVRRYIMTHMSGS